jgi:hypothetical protein
MLDTDFMVVPSKAVPTTLGSPCPPPSLNQLYAETFITVDNGFNNTLYDGKLKENFRENEAPCVVFLNTKCISRDLPLANLWNHA